MTEEALGFLTTPIAGELLGAYAAIEDKQLRREVLSIVQSIARTAKDAARPSGKLLDSETPA